MSEMATSRWTRAGSRFALGTPKWPERPWFDLSVRAGDTWEAKEFQKRLFRQPGNPPACIRVVCRRAGDEALRDSESRSASSPARLQTTRIQAGGFPGCRKSRF